MNKREGSSILIFPILLVLFFLFVIIFSKLIIELILPFIYYQKLDLIANKYLFVIEKFGYLTEKEKINLINDLQKEGFNQDLLTIDYPNYKKDYGELIHFNINYIYKIKGTKLLNINDNYINIKVSKNSFSKI